MTTAEIAALLEARGLDVRRVKDGYMSQCPTHDDPTPSLHLTDKGDRTLLRCHAGCATQGIVLALGVGMRDLFNDGRRPSGNGGPLADPAPATLPTEDELAAGVASLDADAATQAQLRRWRGWADPAILRRLGIGRAKHGRLAVPIRSGDGQLVGVTEYDPDPARKGPKSVSTGTRNLFPAPEVVKAGELWLVEGEPDAVSAYTLGLLACSVPGAAWWAGSRGHEAAERLRLRPRVYVLPDCDAPGREWAARAAADCAAAGIDARVVDLDPTRSDGYDLTDLLGDAPSAPVARKYLKNRADGSQPVKVKGRPAHLEWPAPLEADAFHGLAGRIVRAFDPHTEADPAAILVQFLAAFGNAVGRQTHYLHESNRHPCSLYVLIIGRSAKSRKGTSWGRVAAIMEQADPAWAADRIMGGLSSGEGLIFEVRDPVTERVATNGARGSASEDDGEEEDEDGNGWVEKVIDPGTPDKRLLVVESEFSQPLRVMRREGNTLSANLRNLWDRGTGGAITKTTRTRTHDAHVSVIGHAVAEELRRELTSMDLTNGFANRFLFVCARRSKSLPFGGQLDDHDLMALSHEVAVAIEWASTLTGVSLDADAAMLWEKLYNAELGVERPGLIGSVTARAEAYVIRLALIYALLDGAAIIRPAHLRAALAVWRYCAASARFIFARTGTGVPDADKLLEALREAGERGLTRTELSAVTGRNWSRTRLSEALDVLLTGELVSRTEERPPRGRPVERWHAS
jgi:hypothetical protein